MPNRKFIPTLLSYQIRVALDAILPGDEAYFYAAYADLDGLSWLLSLRANAGSAERIATASPPLEDEEPSHGHHHTPG